MFNAIIEISKNSNLKYEFDKDNNCLKLDRVLPNSNYFPYNYGFILILLHQMVIQLI